MACHYARLTIADAEKCRETLDWNFGVRVRLKRKEMGDSHAMKTARTSLREDCMHPDAMFRDASRLGVGTTFHSCQSDKVPFVIITWCHKSS